MGTLLSGCDSLRPTRVQQYSPSSQLFMAPTMLPTSTIVVQQETQQTPQITQVADCTNDLVYLGDLTIPDGTQVVPGTVLEKEWQVKNNGTCNWNESYTLQLVSGPALGAPSPQALVPARNGAEAVITISIIAPDEPARYSSTWRAFGPDGQPFGEWFSVEFIVTSP
jgi:hypothetical protein